MSANGALCAGCPLRALGLSSLGDVAGGRGGVVFEALAPDEILRADERGARPAFLRSGALKVEALAPDGSGDVIGFVLPGEPVAVSHAGMASVATALVPSQACRLSVPAILARDAQAARVLDAFRAAALAQAVADQSRLARARHGPVTDRLAGFLGDIASRTGDRRIALAMPRSDIAAYLALRPESVSRAMAALRRSGRIEREGPRRLRWLGELEAPGGPPASAADEVPPR